MTTQPFTLQWHTGDHGEALAHVQVTDRELTTKEVFRLTGDLHVMLEQMRWHDATYLCCFPEAQTITMRSRYHLLRKAAYEHDRAGAALCGVTPGTQGWSVYEVLPSGAPPYVNSTCRACVARWKDSRTPEE